MSEVRQAVEEDKLVQVKLVVVDKNEGKAAEDKSSTRIVGAVTGETSINNEAGNMNNEPKDKTNVKAEVMHYFNKHNTTRTVGDHFGDAALSSLNSAGVYLKKAGASMSDAGFSFVGSSLMAAGTSLIDMSTTHEVQAELLLGSRSQRVAREEGSSNRAGRAVGSSNRAGRAVGSSSEAILQYFSPVGCTGHPNSDDGPELEFIKPSSSTSAESGGGESHRSSSSSTSAETESSAATEFYVGAPVSVSRLRAIFESRQG